MIFVLVGYSGVGKTALTKEILNINKNLRQLVLVTDRPKRGNECDGKDYHFVSKETYDKLLDSDLLVTNEVINVYQDVWRYGILKSSINDNLIFAGSPEQVNQLKCFLGRCSVASIYINVPEEMRLKRIFNRNDNQHKKEIERRTIDDRKKYSQFVSDFTVDNVGNLSDTATAINTTIELLIKQFTK